MAEDEIYTDDELSAFDMEAEPDVVVKKGLVEKIGDVIFNLMRRKKPEKNEVPIEPIASDNTLFEDNTEPLTHDAGESLLAEETEPTGIDGTHVEIPEGVDVPYLFSQQKHTARTRVFTTGLALITFVVGSIVIYTQIPTHMELLVGIVMVIVSGHILLAYSR
jgi:hypothetical protein